MEFWGDTIEDVRWFKVADQRSLEVAPHGLWAPPCRELLLTPEVRARAKALAPEHPERRRRPRAAGRGHRRRGHGVPRPGAGRYPRAALSTSCLPVLYVLVRDPQRVRTRAHDLVATSEEFLAVSGRRPRSAPRTPLDLGAAAFRTLTEVREHALAGGRPVVDDHAVRRGRGDVGDLGRPGLGVPRRRVLSRGHQSRAGRRTDPARRGLACPARHRGTRPRAAARWSGLLMLTSRRGSRSTCPRPSRPASRWSPPAEPRPRLCQRRTQAHRLPS